jgi:signal peptidase I
VTRPRLTRLRLTAAVALAAAAVVVLLRAEVVEAVEVSSDSMRPTLQRGDDVLLDKLAPRLRALRRGELVTFNSPQDGALVLKRIVGVAGDTIEIRDAVLYVNDKRVHEPQVDLAAFDATYFGPVCVPAGQVFVLGDNRAVSVDSRAYGGIPVGAVTGRVLLTLR